jgi:hypothetical protein
VPTASALHALEPGCVRVTAHWWRRAVRDISPASV